MFTPHSEPTLPTLLGCFDCAIVQPGSRVDNRDNLTRERGSSKSLSSVLDVHIGSSVALQYTIRGRRSRGTACGCLVVIQGAIGAMGKGRSKPRAAVLARPYFWAMKVGRLLPQIVCVWGVQGGNSTCSLISDEVRWAGAGCWGKETSRAASRK